jgi:hypothetical protein
MTERHDGDPAPKKTEGDREEYKQTPVASIVSALLVVVAITVAIFVAKGYYSKAENTPPKIVATAIEPKSEIEEAREQAEAEARKKVAEEQAAEQEEAAEKGIYAVRLKIKLVRLKKTKGGDIEVSGSVRNTGNREVNGISLVLYCLDAQDRPVCRKKIAVEPKGGVPLRKHQRLLFKTEIPRAPEGTKDVGVVVADMSFAD